MFSTLRSFEYKKVGIMRKNGFLRALELLEDLKGKLEESPIGEGFRVAIQLSEKLT